jgi:sporulation protein YlmC with PRC-barrel domain
MNKLQFVLATGALALTGAAYAQNEAQPPPADSTGAPVSPAPSTSPTEGTAADRTSPQSTPTASEPSTGAANPTPSTDPSEGTAADRTAPGQTSTSGSDDNMRMAAAGTRGQSASQLIGASVQGTSGDTVGTVQDVLIDQSGKVSAVLIQQSGSSSTTGTQPTSIPWDAVKGMDADGKITIDSSRVKNVQGSELR